MKINAKYAFFTIILLANVLFAQNNNQAAIEPRWVKGVGSEVSKTFDPSIYDQALNKARADALRQLGVTIKAGEYRQKTEDSQALTDFYSSFAESSTRGIIIDERNIKKSKPEQITPEGSDIPFFKVTVEIEALVAAQVVDPDPTFKVSLEAERDVYVEREPVIFKINSTQDGFLTIFNIKNDTLNVVFPNKLMPKNQIKANVQFQFPAEKSRLRLRLLPNSGQQKSDEMFVAIVTKENIPFDEGAIVTGKVPMKQAMLSAYAQWLYKISPDRRCSDTKVISVTKKNK